LRVGELRDIEVLVKSNANAVGVNLRLQVPTRIFIPLNKMRFVIGPNNISGLLDPSEERAYKLHSHTLEPHQCGSILVQHINAPIESVWSIVQAFDKPQVYKKFIQTCNMTRGDGGVGSVREVYLISGIPATSSVERLELLDDEAHIFSFRVLTGCHRLQNYWSVTSLHEQKGNRGTTVVESYVVDVPDGNTREETHMFADTVVRCNLKSLAQVSEQRAVQEVTQRLSASAV
jgi:abscisic acid receptor (PYR/PYL family)